MAVVVRSAFRATCAVTPVSTRSRLLAPIARAQVVKTVKVVCLKESPLQTPWAPHLLFLLDLQIPQTSPETFPTPKLPVVAIPLAATVLDTYQVFTSPSRSVAFPALSFTTRFHCTSHCITIWVSLGRSPSRYTHSGFFLDFCTTTLSLSAAPYLSLPFYFSYLFCRYCSHDFLWSLLLCFVNCDCILYPNACVLKTLNHRPSWMLY